MNVKVFVTALMLFLWLHPVDAQDLDAKEKERMANAKVKTQTQWTYDYVDGKPSSKGYKSAVTKFNNKGNVTEIINYNEDGKIISIVVYQYDKRDNRVSYERYKGNRNKLEYSQKIVFDAKGNKGKEQGFDGAAMYNNTFQYDAAGKLSEITYMVDNALVEKRKLTYNGNKTDIQIFNASNKLIYRQENTYNDKGLLVTEVKTGGQGNVLHTLDKQYNSVGDLTKKEKKRADDKPDYQKSYFYDNDNRLIREETINLDGTKFVSCEYQYNPSGDLIFKSWKKTEKAKEPSTTKYTYDAKGLYTEMECYFATYPLKTLYRYVYEYY
jgi:hypothetical protein